MAQTINRNKSTGSVPSVGTLLSAFWSMDFETAQRLATFGKLGRVIASMIAEKSRKAKKAADPKLLKRKAAIQASIDEKVNPVIAALQDISPKADLEGLRQLAIATVCQSEMAEIASIDAEIDAAIKGVQQDVINAALTDLMGSPVSRTSLAQETVYVVVNNAPRFHKMAFAFDHDDTPTIFVENGDTWESVDIEFNDYAPNAFTSKRALQKVHYVYNALGTERLQSMFSGMDSDYNPFSGITPKARAEVEEELLDTWQ